MAHWKLIRFQPFVLSSVEGRATVMLLDYQLRLSPNDGSTGLTTNGPRMIIGLQSRSQRLLAEDYRTTLENCCYRIGRYREVS